MAQENDARDVADRRRACIANAIDLAIYQARTGAIGADGIVTYALYYYAMMSLGRNTRETKDHIVLVDDLACVVDTWMMRYPEDDTVVGIVERLAWGVDDHDSAH